MFVMILGSAQAAFVHGEDSEVENPQDVLNRAREAKGEEAVRLFLLTVKAWPDSEQVRYELGGAYYDTERYAEALAAYQKAAELGYEAGDVQTRIGKCLAKLDKHAEAEAAYRKALAADPQSVSAQFGLAGALFNQDRSAEAVPLFETLGKRDDDWGRYAREYLGYAYYETEAYDQAIAVLTPLLEANPKDTALRWTRAKSLYKANRNAETLPELERVLKEDPSKGEAARYYIADCLRRMGHRREAEKAFEQLAKDSASDWGAYARDQARAMKGKAYTVFVDYVGGYDTGIVQPGDEVGFVGGKDYFNQVFAQFEGRVLREDRFELWLAGRHFGLHYPELHDNDYFEDSGVISFRIDPGAVFKQIEVSYAFKYAQLDYQPYEREHTAEVRVTWEDAENRLRWGGHFAYSDYFREAQGVSGPEARFFVDYRRKLPLWEHWLRLRANADHRWSDDEASERSTQRVRLKYRAQMAPRLEGFLEATWRRDDYPQSQAATASHRTDHRLKGEVRMEYMINRHFYINWGTIYESVDSRREAQEYGRYQFDGGFTISF